MKYQLLKEVLEHLEAYEKQEENTSLEGFSLFINKQLSLLHTNTDIAYVPPNSDEVVRKMSRQAFGFENHITYLIAMMWKYAKHYIKLGFKDLPIKSIDDFGFLATLAATESMTKTALIQKNIVEIPSGMDIIKRLEKQQCIESYNDPNDRRAKRLKITAKGRAILGASIGQLMKIAKIVIGDLTLEERMQMMAILDKLNNFHMTIHQNDWKSSLHEIETKYTITI